MSTPGEDDVLTMDGWPGGVNNRARETEQLIDGYSRKMLSSKFLRKALNVDLTAEGHPLRRRGYELITGGYAHSVYGCDRLGIFCAVIDGELRVGREPTELSVVAEVSRYNPVSYCMLNDSIYYSNGQVLGEITDTLQHRPWGIPVAPTPTVAGPAAANPGGWTDTRQVSVAYVDYYGREGGASEPVLVGADGAFTVSIPMPLPDGVAKAQVYASQPNSEILYHVETMIITSPITVHPVNIGTGRELDTLNLKPPRAGQLVCSLNGRIYIARNNNVTFTEALRYHLTRPSQGIYMVPEYITLLEPAHDGIYVGTKHGVVFIAGNDPYTVQQTHVSPYAPVERAVTRVPGEKFGVSVDELPVWWGSDGAMVVGLPGGQLRQLTRDRLAVPKFAAGAVSVREREGMSHIVTTLRSSDGMNPMGASDTVVASVRQNNIVLNT